MYSAKWPGKLPQAGRTPPWKRKWPVYGFCHRMNLCIRHRTSSIVAVECQRKGRAWVFGGPVGVGSDRTWLLWLPLGEALQA